MKYKKDQDVLELNKKFEEPIFHKSKIRIFDNIYKYLNWYEIFFIIVCFFIATAIIISQIRFLIEKEYYWVSIIFYPIVGIAVLILLSFNLILIIVTHEISRQNKKCQNIFILWTIGIIIFVFSMIAINLTKKEIEDQKNILQI